MGHVISSAIWGLLLLGALGNAIAIDKFLTAGCASESFSRITLNDWIYIIFQVDLYNRSEIVDLSSYTPNGEWQLLGKPKITRLIRVLQSDWKIMAWSSVIRLSTFSTTHAVQTGRSPQFQSRCTSGERHCITCEFHGVLCSTLTAYYMHSGVVWAPRLERDTIHATSENMYALLKCSIPLHSFLQGTTSSSRAWWCPRWQCSCSACHRTRGRRSPSASRSYLLSQGCPPCPLASWWKQENDLVHSKDDRVGNGVDFEFIHNHMPQKRLPCIKCILAGRALVFD